MQNKEVCPNTGFVNCNCIYCSNRTHDFNSNYQQNLNDLILQRNRYRCIQTSQVNCACIDCCKNNRRQPSLPKEIADNAARVEAVKHDEICKEHQKDLRKQQNVNNINYQNILDVKKGLLDKEIADNSTKAAAVKYDDGKPPLDLLSYQAKVEIAKVFGFGAKKYGRYNYKKGMDWSKVIAAAERHLGAFNSGEDLDPESGLPHLGHLGCCVFMLLDYYFNNKDKDDRYKNAASKTE